MDMCIILWINIEFNLFFCIKFCVFFKLINSLIVFWVLYGVDGII